MLNYYRKNLSYAAQMRWIRENPGKYAAYNAIGIALLIGYYYILERREEKRLEELRTQHNL